MAIAAEVAATEGSTAALARTGEGGGPIGVRRDCRRDCGLMGKSLDAATVTWFPEASSLG
jgi:hypothetical protein